MTITSDGMYTHLSLSQVMEYYAYFRTHTSDRMPLFQNIPLSQVVECIPPVSAHIVPLSEHIWPILRACT